MTAALKIDLHDGHPIWGRCVFLWALTDDAEEVRAAYAQGFGAWPPVHFAISGPGEQELDPWYRLGFAQMHAYGARASGGERTAVAGVALRRGGPEDLETAMRIDRLIHEVQAEPPSASAAAFDEAGHRAVWLETLEADDVAYFVAERDGVPVGHTTLYPDVEDAEALHLASTAVAAAERGSGIGVLLTTHALAYAAEQGYPRLRTNWRVTNLGASRFWPARGFELTHIRLVRRLPDL